MPPVRSLPVDLQHDLNALQSVLDGVTTKAADEGYALEIHTEIDEDGRGRYRPTLVRRFFAVEIERSRPTPIK